MSLYGYIRGLSAPGQQQRTMQELGVPVENICMDKAGDVHPAFEELMGRLRPGDELYVPSIDALGKVRRDIQASWKRLVRRSVDIIVMDTALLDTRRHKDLSDVVPLILSFVSENGRMNQRRRREGTAAALARGVEMGRPRRENPHDFDTLAELWKNRELRTVDFMELTGLSENTLYRRLREKKVARG
jgi:DNA invertase Pin-like site-specific DNA recombinase